MFQTGLIKKKFFCPCIHAGYDEFLSFRHSVSFMQPHCDTQELATLVPSGPKFSLTTVNFHQCF